MSFVIRHGVNRSSTNTVNKEIGWHTPDIEGVLRDGCSLIDPVILVQASSPGFHANNSNYIYVQEFQRYYYITNIVSVNNTLWELHCHVDVLMSYADQIAEQVAVVSRQERKYNLMLDDGWFMSYQNPIVITKRFSVSAPFETQEFVLVVAGGG